MHFDRRGAAAGLAAYVLWGLLTVYWHELEGLSAFGLIGQRIVWSTLVLGAVIVVTRRAGELRAAWRAPGVPMRVIAAALLLSANWTTYVWAVTHDNVVETALGYFIAPLGTVAIGVVLFDERLRRAQSVALAIAAAAVVVLTLDYGHVPAFALTLGLTWGVYGLSKRTVPLHPIESLTAETVVLLPVALVIVAVVESSGSAIRHAASGSQLVLVALTGVVTVVPLLLFAHAAPRVPFTILGPLQYAVPSINFVLGVALYGEAMPAARVSGFALVWLALAIFTVDSVRAARRAHRGLTHLCL
jgi:chloramphenicol-sensitive protein RarD